MRRVSVRKQKRIFNSLGIRQLVSGVGQSQPRGVGTELLDGFTQGQEVTGTLGHLLSVQHQVSVGSHSLGPVLFAEKGGVDVDTEGQVVRDQVLSRRPDIHRVEVLVVVLELGGLFLFERLTLGEGSVSEDVSPNLISHLISGDTERSHFVAVDTALVEQVGDGVVRHVDGGVAQRFNEELRVPGKLGAETVASSTCPLVEPVQDGIKGVSDFGEEGVHTFDKAIE